MDNNNEMLQPEQMAAAEQQPTSLTEMYEQVPEQPCAPEMRRARKTQSIKEIFSDLLSRNCLDEYGNEIQYDGEELTNIKRVGYGLMKSAAKGNTKAVELMLTLSGMRQAQIDAQKEEDERAKRHEEEKTKQQLAAYKAKIDEIFERSGIDDPLVMMMSDLLATAIMGYDKIRYQYLSSNEPAFIVELSREGMERKKPNPLAEELRQQSRNVSEVLGRIIRSIGSETGKKAVASQMTAFLDSIASA